MYMRWLVISSHSLAFEAKLIGETGLESTCMNDVILDFFEAATDIFSKGNGLIEHTLTSAKRLIKFHI